MLEEIKNEIAESIEGCKSDMFATEANLSDVISKYNVKGEDVAIIMIVVNTTLQRIADSVRSSKPEIRL